VDRLAILRVDALDPRQIALVESLPAQVQPIVALFPPRDPAVKTGRAELRPIGVAARVSAAPDGTPGDGFGGEIAVLATGSGVVTFRSTAGNLVVAAARQVNQPDVGADAAPSPPYPALLLQMFRDAKYMLDVRVAPLYGAIVMTNDAWNKIDAGDRPAVLAAAKTIEKRLLGEAPKLDADSIATMKSRGLTVTTLDPKAAAEFRAAAESFVKSMRGNIVPADAYDAALKERDAYRKTRK